MYVDVQLYQYKVKQESIFYYGLLVKGVSNLEYTRTNCKIKCHLWSGEINWSSRSPKMVFSTLQTIDS